MWNTLEGILVLHLLSVVWASNYCDVDMKAITPCAGTTAEECANYGCCWDANQKPSCFFQMPKYFVKERSNTTYGITMTIAIDDESNSGKFPGSPISPLQVDITKETYHRLHIKITDPNDQRWEIPESLLPLPPPPSKPFNFTSYQYLVPKVGEEFFFVVNRTSFDVVEPIFNTSSTGFIYSNQLLQIGTSLATLGDNTHVFGFGEHKTSLRLDHGQGQTITLWNYDGGTPEHLNLYGSHPFYLGKEPSYTHGVFLRNSNGMDVEISDRYLKYNVIGATCAKDEYLIISLHPPYQMVKQHYAVKEDYQIKSNGVLDFYFFLGPQADDVVNQYYDVVGRPAMPPYWALGFHQCRYGYKNLLEVKDVVNNYAKYEIPLDTMWTDIDYMDNYKDFTVDSFNFPLESMRQFINELHMDGQHYVVIVDPGISVTKGYKAYDDGVSMDIFIKDHNNEVFVGKVWPGYTAFPDFSNPLTTEYWTKQIAAFHDAIPVDGLWLDMNEPSNFCDGACNMTSRSVRRYNLNFDPLKPPYTIGNRKAVGSTESEPLNKKTFDMDAKHHSGATAYNMHNLYGFTESMATRKALLMVKEGKRPFVLSRSTFSGSGGYAAHWLGDDVSTAEDMSRSISTILNFQILGVPLVGADICGFGGDTTEELCARWMELGSFYPFARNHNSVRSTSQEPYIWSSVAAVSRKYLALRYSLLPYYYTLFVMVSGISKDVYSSYTSILRPLFYDYPDDTSIDMDTEFLVGGGLLVAPQLSLGSDGKEMDVYLPKDVWYDWYTHEMVSDSVQSKVLSNVPTPIDFVPIYIRGGHIIPMQEPGLTTTESRKKPYSLLVALNFGRADGELYLDDGETYNTTEYTSISYSCEGTQLTSFASGTKYATKANLPLLKNVTILGVIDRPSVVALDGVPKEFKFIEGKTFKLIIDNLSVSMDSSFTLNWM